MKKKQSGTECCGIAVHCAFDEFADVVTLQPNPRNPNKHGDKQVAMLAKIIRHQGWRAPVVVSRRSGFVVAGHGRLQAAALLQVEKVPVNYQDFATEADEWAHLVADNRIAELADMDNDALAEILRDLDGLDMDAELTGFDDSEIEKITGEFSVNDAGMPDLPSGDKQPFQQKTFTLHDSQAAAVDQAVSKAKKLGAGESDCNENSNGNALAFICEQFNNANP